MSIGSAAEDPAADGGSSIGAAIGAASGVYRPATERAVWAVRMLAAMAVSALIGSGLAAQAIVTLEQIFGGDDAATADLKSIHRSQDHLALCHNVLWLITTVVFCLWVYRAHANLRPLGARGVKYTPGWAVGSYFVPILNLFRPYQITQEIYRGSDPETIGESIEPWRVAGSVAIIWWWGCWTAMRIVAVTGRVAFRLPETDDEYRILYWFDFAAIVLTVISLVLAIIVVREIQQRQEARDQRLRIMRAGDAQNDSATTVE